MPKIEDVRNSVSSELKMLQMLSQLSPGDFERLMEGQKEYATAVQTQKEAEKEEYASKRRDIEREISELEEREQTTRTQMQMEARRENAEQERKFQLKLVEKQSEEEKKRVDYALQRETEVQKERTRIKLQARREFDKLDIERKRREEEIEEAKASIRRREREEEFARIAELERTKLVTKAEMDKKAELELADHRFSQKLRLYEATKEQEAARKRELLTIQMDYQKQIARQKWDSLLGFFSGSAGKDRVNNMARLVGISAVSFGVVRMAIPLVREYISRFLFAPKLVNRREAYSSLGSLFRRAPDIQVFLNSSLSKRMDRILLSTRNTHRNRGYYGNLLLYGLPGTRCLLFLALSPHCSSRSFTDVLFGADGKELGKRSGRRSSPQRQE